MRVTIKRTLAVLLSLILAIGLLPASAGAAEGGDWGFFDESRALMAGDAGRFDTEGFEYPTGESGGIWSSSDYSVIEVFDDSTYSCIKAGSATITVYAGGEERRLFVTVTGTEPQPTYSIQLNCGSQEMDAGDTFHLYEYASVSPAGTSVSWRSTNANVAEVSADGVVTAKGQGSCEISASVGDGADFDSIWVNVTAPTFVGCSPSCMDLKVGESGQISVNANRKVTVVWSSSNENVATVNQIGCVSAVGVGSATILAVGAAGTLGSGTCQVNVTPVPVDSRIELKQTAVSVYTGNTVELQAVVLPEGTPIRWNATNDNVQILSSTNTGCVVKGVKGGTTSNVYAVFAEDSSKFAQAVVTVVDKETPVVKKGTIAFDQYSISPKVGETIKITATPTPADMPIQGWSSNNTAVATVDQNGNVKGIAEGTATISAYNTEYGALTTCTAYVGKAVKTPTLSTTSISVDAGKISDTVSVKDMPDWGWVKWYVTAGKSSYVSLISSGTNNQQLQVKGLESGSVTVTGNVCDKDGYLVTSLALKVTVKEPSGKISYQVNTGSSVDLLPKDFYNLCRDLVGGTLNYITITKLPSSTYGTLYENGKAANTLTRYYYNNTSPSLDDLHFQASSSSGTVSFTFTGWSGSGRSFDGTVSITINKASNEISYSVFNTSFHILNAADFNDICKKVTGKELESIMFTGLPASERGTLYENYGSPSKSAVKTNTLYYYSGRDRLISSVTFVPSESCTGTISIPFTGTGTNAKTFTGSLLFNIKKGSAAAVEFSVEQGKKIALSSNTFGTYCKSITSETLRDIQFLTVPVESQGYLYTSHGAATVSTVYSRTGTANLIDDLVFESGAVVGKVELPFAGHSTSGKSFTGTVVIQVYSQAADVKLNFTDVPADASYYKDLQYVIANNIFAGTSATTFSPNTTMTRAQMVQVLWRVAGSVEPKTANRFSDVTTDAYYYKSVAWAAENGITGGTSATTFSPDIPITREQFLTILYSYAKTTPRFSSMSSWVSIDGYRDRNAVDDWAVDALQWAMGNGIAYDIFGNLEARVATPRFQVAEFLARFCQKYQ